MSYCRAPTNGARHRVISRRYTSRSERSGQLIPLSNLVQLREVAGPVDLRRFDRLRSISISASLNDGYSLGTAISDLEKIVRDNLPPSARLNYDGESRDMKNTGGAIYTTFLLALVIAYLVLSAQFESFKHPLIIMTTVPLAITGALVGLVVFGSSLNIYSQIGAIMLIGLAAKNGVLIVDFANQLRDRGTEFREAIIQAAKTRLRPVLMTSMCTSFGAVPLLLASGAGELSRQSIGAVVFFGVTFAVLLTLPRRAYRLQSDREEYALSRVRRSDDRQVGEGRSYSDVTTCDASASTACSVIMTIAIGAASPGRGPVLRMRRYPPGRSLNRAPISVNSFPTASLSRRRSNAKRRFATLSSLARVISGSTTRRSSFAFGSVVLIVSCLNIDAAMLRNMALR